MGTFFDTIVLIAKIFAVAFVLFFAIIAAVGIVQMPLTRRKWKKFAADIDSDFGSVFDWQEGRIPYVRTRYGNWALMLYARRKGGDDPDRDTCLTAPYVAMGEPASLWTRPKMGRVAEKIIDSTSGLFRVHQDDRVITQWPDLEAVRHTYARDAVNASLARRFLEDDKIRDILCRNKDITLTLDANVLRSRIRQLLFPNLPENAGMLTICRRNLVRDTEKLGEMFLLASLALDQLDVLGEIKGE
ncbi:hypothetical protein ACFL1X_12740 [Candidatus Hydrogenedentota bacterium]